MVIISKGIIGILVGIIITAFIIIFKERLKDFGDFLINKFLDRFKFKISLYKKKTRDLLLILEDITGEKEGEEIVKHSEIKYIKADQIKVDDDEWKIIKIDRNQDESQIEQSVILQLPSVTTYYKERNLLSKDYRRAFFFSISYTIALKKKRFNLTSLIISKIEEEGITNEFHIFCEILKDKDKHLSFVEEARRRWKSKRGYISPTSIKEFCDFINGLSQGNLSTLHINHLQFPLEEYCLRVRNLLHGEKYIGLYLFARSNPTSTKGNIDLLNRLVEKIPNEIGGSKIHIEDTGIYAWLDLNDKTRYNAKTVIIKKA